MKMKVIHFNDFEFYAETETAVECCANKIKKSKTNKYVYKCLLDMK